MNFISKKAIPWYPPAFNHPSSDSFLQDNYPERLYRVLVHPVGILFYGGWSVAKWFLDKNTQEKVQPMLYLTGVQSLIDDKYIPDYMVRGTIAN